MNWRNVVILTLAFAFLAVTIKYLSYLKDLENEESFKRFKEESEVPLHETRKYESLIQAPNYTVALFEEDISAERKSTTLIRQELLTNNFSVPLTVIPCNYEFRSRYSCHKMDDKLFIFNKGRLYDNSYTYTNRTLNQILNYLEKYTRKIKIVDTVQDLEDEFGNYNTTIVVQFSKSCKKWSSQIYLDLMTKYSQNDAVQFLTVTDEDLIRLYTNSTQDSFRILSHHDWDRFLLKPNKHIGKTIEQYLTPIISEYKEENPSMYNFTVINTSNKTQAWDLVPVAKHFRGRLTLYYNVTQDPEPSLFVHIANRIESYTSVSPLFYYNSDVDDVARLISWIEAVLNGTAVHSEGIPKIANEPFKALVGDTIEEFMNQEKDIVLIVTRIDPLHFKSSYRYLYDGYLEQLSRFKQLAQQLEYVPSLEFGTIDANKNTVPLLQHIADNRRTMVLFCPVGSKRDPYLIDIENTDKEIIDMLREYAVAAKDKF